MEYNPLVLKLGTSECAEFYSDILYRDDLNLKDNVMLSVMRMLLTEERLKSMTETGGRVQLQISESLYYSDGSESNKNDFVHEESPFNMFRFGIMIIIDHANLLKKSEEYNADYEALGWVKLEDVSQYIDKDGDVLVYQNITKKGSIIFTKDKKAIQAAHLAASCIPRLMPWCFENAPITDTEKDIVRYLYEGNEKAFCDAMQKIYDSEDFYGKEIAMKLKGFCNINYENIIETREREINAKKEKIDYQFEIIRGLQNQLEELLVQLAAIRDKVYCTDDKELEIVNYLKVNKTLKFLCREGDRMYIGFNGFLNDCDELQFKHSVENKKNKDNYIYGKSPYSFKETKAFFLSIWKEHRFNIRTYCEWYITSGDSVCPILGSNMKGHYEMKENRIRQPHIDRHGCYGGYRNMLETLAKDCDYIGTLTTIISSSSSLNWGDSTVVSQLMYDLFNNEEMKNKKVMEDAQGNLYTVEEVFEILRKENTAAKEA